VIGFGGRSLGDEQPKYLNSPETELFDKGRTLFCLDRAKKAISQQDMAVVVEGYFDANSLSMQPGLIMW
jgi:DNA primase